MLPFPPLEGFVEFSFGQRAIDVPERLPVLALSNGVLFPGCPARLKVMQEMNTRALAAVGNEEFPFVVAVARSAPQDDLLISASQLHAVGVVARIRSIRQESDGVFCCLLECGPRCRVRSAVRDASSLMLAELEDASDPQVTLDSIDAGARDTLWLAARDSLVREFASATWAHEFLKTCTDAALLAGIATAELDLTVSAAARLLAAPADERVKEVLWMLREEAVRR